jgi:hypothetical protein
LDITPGKAISVDERLAPAFRIPDDVKLSPNYGDNVPDGEYERRFVFDGRPYQHKVRMLDGRMQQVW